MPQLKFTETLIIFNVSLSVLNRKLINLRTKQGKNSYLCNLSSKTDTGN